MNLLDTNVLFEFMRPQPSEAVTAWLDRLPAEQVWPSAISFAEIALGLALMPTGKRQAALALAAQAMFEEDSGGAACPSMSVRYSTTPLSSRSASVPIAPSAPKMPRSLPSRLRMI